MKKEIILILLGLFLGVGLSIFGQNQTWWKANNYSHQQENDKTPEVQIWCELRMRRMGGENYCKWNGKFWELTCKGDERFLGEEIEPNNYGNYGCED